VGASTHGLGFVQVARFIACPSGPCPHP
jgi:hypothetical protein